MTRKQLRLQFLIPIATAGLVLAACTGDDEEPEAEDTGSEEAEDPADEADDDTTATEFAREETVFTGGAEWSGFADWNPNTSGESTYVQGFIYEGLFHFDPWNAELIPWLAESGEWISDETYEVVLRDGILWHDGEQLTGDDVKFTFDLREIDGVEFVDLDTYLDEVEVVDDLTVQFHFSDPRRGQWDNELYKRQIVPEHTWSTIPREEIPENDGTDLIIGSGAYQYHSHEFEDRARYERYDDWWAIEHLGMEMAARYVVDFQNQSNDVALAQLEQDELDLANFGIIGIQNSNSFGDKLHTFYDEPPYMLSANTASLIPNHTRAPTSDAELRRALAYSVDVADILSTAYQDIVAPAHPTAMIPLWTDQEGMVDEDVVAEHGFSYDPAEAERILDEAGYEDVDGDGLRETPDGEPMELEFLVQSGWVDWEDAADVIADSAEAVGINLAITPTEPGELDVLREEGDYDLVIDNQLLISNHLFEQYYYMYQLPIVEDGRQVDRDNPQRYENERAWELTQEIARLTTPPSGDQANDDRFREVHSELQEIGLEDMVIIPLWYNGLWSIVNDTYWTNWPSGEGDPYPTTWSNEFPFGGYEMFTQLEPAG